MSSRVLTTKNLMQMDHSLFTFSGVWQALGTPETHGAWLIYGKEKNGKTWLQLLMADMLSEFARVLIVSAEEGAGADFKKAVIRARIDPSNNRIGFLGYVPFDELKERLKRRRNPERVVFIDNVTTYMEELKSGGVQRLLREFPNTLFIFLAHEEGGEPYTSTGKMVKRLAKRILRVEGLTVMVGGRTEATKLAIDEEKAALIYGQSFLDETA